ncbi:sperm acrosome membrane-associated protein 4-like [Myripristis murdjan]|uniref:sperm acrosome membrane-associated protein 4-like n=1 Tax=Myripristis murdjan TaxID=586833 RepID=UPI001175F2A9|nr:sperm acrosome membrane-associated protein 4-like [Myripristis murdjan]
MNKFLCLCVALGAMFAAGESLVCNTCKVGIAGTCLFSSTVTCTDSEPNCYRGNLAFNVSGLLSLQTRGCLDTTSCNKTQTGTLLTAGYTVTKTCCSTDRCNGATSIQLPLTAAVGAALLAMWSTWAY